MMFFQDESHLVSSARSHVQKILTQIFSPSGRVLLVYDAQTSLSQLMASAYKNAWPSLETIHFDQVPSEQILKTFDSLKAGDLVILVQSSSFRLDDFRIRVHLFEKGLKVIEHPHLGRVLPEEYGIYIDSLDYDGAYYRTLGPALKKRLDKAQNVQIHSGENVLLYEGALESAKLNIGDYTGMKNSGGQFPIGEVFTELRDLTHLNGDVKLFAFGDQSFSVFDCQSLVLKIRNGKVVDVTHSVPEFDAVLEDIRNHEGDIWVRELGFGLNRALTRERRIRHDVGIYERMCGVHLSLGSKHALYPKLGFHKKKVKYHVDVFVAVDSVLVDGKIIYREGMYEQENNH